MKFDIGLSPQETLFAAVCALGGVIGFFAALVQIWEFIEKRPHLRRILVGWVRASLAFAVLSGFVIAFIVFVPVKGGGENPGSQPPSKPDERIVAKKDEPKQPPPPPPPAPITITRWVVVVPNNVTREQYRKVCAAAATWSQKSVAMDDLVTMVNFSDRGLVLPLKDVAGRLARTDLPERVSGIPLYPRGSIDEAIAKAYDYLGRPKAGRRDVVVILSGNDPRGYREAARPSIGRADVAKLNDAGH